MRRMVRHASRILGAGPPHSGRPHHAHHHAPEIPPGASSPSPHHHGPPPPHHAHHVSGWIPNEEIQNLAERLAPHVTDPEYWARVILSDPGPGRLHSLLTLAVLETLEDLASYMESATQEPDGTASPEA